MWDIIGYVEKEVSLLLRKGDIYYILSYPWVEPSPIPLLLAKPKAEAIKVGQDELLDQLKARAVTHALHHVCEMSRGAFAGKTAGSISGLVKESLKFALKRRKSALASPQDFLQMLMSCAILEPIPDGFWTACSSFMSTDAVTKLRGSLEALSPLRPVEFEWVKPVTAYLQRVKWIQNEFLFIQVVARELAVTLREHECGPALNDLRIQSTGLLQREQIEKDMASQKPWQKNAMPGKKSIRIGPASSTKKNHPPKGEDESNK